MASYADKILQAVKEGRKIEIKMGPPPTLPKEKAIQMLRRPTVLYYEGASGYGLRNARYVFDFSRNEWEKESVAFPNSPETGPIPAELAEKFLETVWPVCNLPESVYKTESKQVVPASDEERYILQSDTKRLTRLRTLISDKMLEWIAETDTSEPYCMLTAAFSELLIGLDLWETGQVPHKVDTN